MSEKKIYLVSIILIMVYPVQVCSSFVVSYGQISSPRTEADAVDLPKAEGPGKVLVNAQSLQMENLDGGVLGNARHDEHLSAGVEAKVVYLRGQVQDGLLGLRGFGGSERLNVVDVDDTRGGACSEVGGADIQGCPQQRSVILEFLKAVLTPAITL